MTENIIDLPVRRQPGRHRTKPISGQPIAPVLRVVVNNKHWKS